MNLKPMDSNFLQGIAHEMAASEKTLKTEAGHSPVRPSSSNGNRVDTINQVFALFRLNYHNQYFAAWSEKEHLAQVKKMWLDSLADFTTAQILRAAKYIIENDSYLPTLARMRELCREQQVAEAPTMPPLPAHKPANAAQVQAALNTMKKILKGAAQ